jgi:hypothetical protein
MKTFFEGLSSIEQIYWISAILGSAVFVIVFLLTFIGGDGDADMEADATDFEADDGGVGFQFFTFKNIVAFFTIFGWSGLSCIQNELSLILTLIISTVAGLLMMLATSFLFFWINRLAESGSLRISNAIGKIGEVYLPIGAKRSKIGKVSIKVQGSLRELEALTDEEDELQTGTIVRVTEIVSAEILLVEKISK